MDQAGYRSDFSCGDHLFTIAVLTAKMHEQLPLWVAAVDYQKALNTVAHNSIWTSMMQMGVPSAYVRCLARLYTNQEGSVKTNILSTAFSIRRGTKQGDPLSSKLFNTVLEQVLQKI